MIGNMWKMIGYDGTDMEILNWIFILILMINVLVNLIVTLILIFILMRILTLLSILTLILISIRILTLTMKWDLTHWLFCASLCVPGLRKFNI